MQKTTSSQRRVEGISGLKPLDEFPGTLAERVYLSLRAAILELVYPPGAPLPKREICETLGVSRSPISEAIARLASDRLVKVVPQAGTFVARFSMADIREAVFIREAIEVAAIRELALKITDAQLVALRRNLKVQEALLIDGDFVGFYQFDLDFHSQLMSCTGYTRLTEFAEIAWVHLRRARQQILPERGRSIVTLGEHLAILEALEARDAMRAEIALRKHLRQLVKVFRQLQRSQPELFDLE